MKLPRVLRHARAQTSSRADPYSFNKGFDKPSYFDLPDALRGSVRITGDQQAVFAQIEQAARNVVRRRG
jgi:hypothetical protein